MTLPAHFAPVAYSLTAVLAWGTSDFLGGFASRRTNVFLLTTLAHASGVLWMLTLALSTHAELPSRTQGCWALAGGAAGGLGLAIFYRALSSGKMGFTAPIAAVLGGAVPVALGIFTEGLPGPTSFVGFALALVGIWLISRIEDHSRPEGIGMAVLAGLGFATYFMCMRQAGDASAMWVSTLAKVASFSVTSVIVLAARQFRPFNLRSAAIGLIAGCLDVTGSLFFVRSSQTGRLDEAVVISSLYPVVTVLLARVFLEEQFTRWRFVGMLAALASVPMIAAR
jgi:drug/metabolite transporter (DMT)-like permease